MSFLNRVHIDNLDECVRADPPRPPKRAKQKALRMTGLPRIKRYQAWKDLKESGLSAEDIANVFKVDRVTVWRGLKRLDAITAGVNAEKKRAEEEDD